MSNAIENRQPTSLENRAMSPQQDIHRSKSEKLPKETVDLMAAVAHLPDKHRAEIDPLLRRVVESTRRRKRILSLVQEALSQLQLDMKYLMFDLEATRRERDAFQQQLEGDVDLEDEF